jgi:hypothetical protein
MTIFAERNHISTACRPFSRCLPFSLKGFFAAWHRQTVSESFLSSTRQREFETYENEKCLIYLFIISICAFFDDVVWPAARAFSAASLKPILIDQAVDILLQSD